MRVLQDVAERIAREAQLLLYKTRVMAMDAYAIQNLPTETAMIFVAATAGQVRWQAFWHAERAMMWQHACPAAAPCGVATPAWGPSPGTPQF